jgi:oligosaccharide repeat unit polymerase
MSLVWFILAAGLATLLSLFLVKRIGNLVLLPLIVISLALIRFGLHYYLLEYWGEISNELEVMGISDSRYLAEGLDNATLFLIFFGIGFYLLGQYRLFFERKLSSVGDKCYKKNKLYLLFCVGLLSVFAFFILNGAGIEDLVSGGFRGRNITGGTGFLFYFSFVAIPSGLILIYEFLRQNRLVSALLVALVFFAVFAVLGGRVRAFILLASFILMYVLSIKLVLKNVHKIAFLFLFCFISLQIFVALSSYRSGVGADDISYSIASLYASFISEIGQIHSLAASAQFAGALSDDGAWTNLFWPLNSMLGSGARSGGVFVVESLLDDFSSGRKWGFHSTMIGDAFLGFGSIGVVVFSFIFGGVLGASIRWYKRGLVQYSFLILLFIELIRVIFETMDKLPEVYVTMVFYYIVVKICSKNRIRPLS